MADVDRRQVDVFESTLLDAGDVVLGQVDRVGQTQLVEHLKIDATQAITRQIYGPDSRNRQKRRSPDLHINTINNLNK